MAAELVQFPRHDSWSDHQECLKIDVPERACYLRFSQATVACSEASYITIRGEAVVADFDEHGRLVGLELLGPGKPCRDADDVSVVNVDDDGKETIIPLAQVDIS